MLMMQINSGRYSRATHPEPKLTPKCHYDRLCPLPYLLHQNLLISFFCEIYNGSSSFPISSFLQSTYSTSSQSVMDWKLKHDHNMNCTSLYIYTRMSSPQMRLICSEVTFLLASVVFVFSVFYAWKAKNHFHHLLQSCNKKTILVLQKHEDYKELYLQTTFQSGKIHL